MWQRSHKYCLEDRKLELRLGPPGEDEEESIYEKSIKNIVKKETHESSFLQLSSPSSSNSALPNKSHKRGAPGPVVGWPPIRSCRKNLASGSSSKPTCGSQKDKVTTNSTSGGNKPIIGSRGLFVKINMDGVPIGRKVDINAYDSYEKLSSAVDILFRGLLQELNVVLSPGCSGQRDSPAGSGIDKKKHEKDKMSRGLLSIGSGEYALIYEDNEGDKMLVGDVPWHTFVSTVKRLRLLKSSDLPTFFSDLPTFNLSTPDESANRKG